MKHIGRKCHAWIVSVIVVATFQCGKESNQRRKRASESELRPDQELPAEKSSLFAGGWMNSQAREAILNIKALKKQCENGCRLRTSLIKRYAEGQMVNSIAVSENGNQFLVSRGNGHVEILNERFQIISQSEVDSGVPSSTLSFDGRYVLATGAEDGKHALEPGLVIVIDGSFHDILAIEPHQSTSVDVVSEAQSGQLIFSTASRSGWIGAEGGQQRRRGARLPAAAAIRLSICSVLTTRRSPGESEALAI